MPLNKNKTYSIGIDVGGSKISGVLFDGRRVIGDYTLATPHDNFHHFLIMLAAVVGPLLDKARQDKIKIDGIGLGIAGMVDGKKGKILKSANIPYLDDKNIALEVSKKIGLPTRLDNDAKCFVRAEAKKGAGEKFKNVYGITLGTGIGGGWWVNNEIYEGAHGGANEPGHMIIDYAQGIDLEGAYHKLMQNNPAKLAEEAYRGDRLAEKAYEEFGRLLGVAFANIANLLDPEIFIIGGSVVKSSDLFLGAAKKTMLEYAISPAAKKIKVTEGKLGDFAGAIGAALLFCDI